MLTRKLSTALYQLFCKILEDQTQILFLLQGKINFNSKVWSRRQFLEFLSINELK